METSDKVIIKLISAFILVWAYLFVTDSDTLHYFFRFDNQGLTWETYLDYAFTRCAIILILWATFDLSPPKYREYIFAFLMLWLGYLVDYILCYNQPYFIWHSIPFCYGLGAGFGMILIFLYKSLWG